MEDPAVPIPILPNELIFEILTWVPVKPLLKFRCVCESWRTLISSQQFVKSHLRNSKSDPNSTTHRLIMWCLGNFKQCSVNSVLYEPDSEPFDLSCPVQTEIVRVVGSCNGLVCLVVDRKDLILWNPSTRIWKKLPHVQENFSKHLNCGFGFDKSNDDYKVVGFFDNIEDESEEVIVLVYSLRNDEWKRINNFAKANWGFYDIATFVNGKLYWVAFEFEVDEGELSGHLVSFDLEKEKAEILQLPSYMQSCKPKVGVYGGSPLVLCGHRTSTVVWIMDDCSVGNKNWTKFVTIPFTDDILKFNCIEALYVKHDLFLLFSSHRQTIMIFDAKDCSISFPDVRTKFRHLQSFFNGEWFQHNTYLESLVSPLV